MVQRSSVGRHLRVPLSSQTLGSLSPVQRLCCSVHSLLWCVIDQVLAGKHQAAVIVREGTNELSGAYLHTLQGNGIQCSCCWQKLHQGLDSVEQPVILQCSDGNGSFCDF